MLKKTTIAMAAAVLMLGAASTAQAGGNSGDYTGGALFGPMPGQVFSYGSAPLGAYGYAYAPGTAYGSAHAPRRAIGHVPSLREEFPNAPWEEY